MKDTKAIKEECFQDGITAFEKNINYAPILNIEFMKKIEKLYSLEKSGHKLRIAMMKAYCNGWMTANFKEVI